MVLYITLMPHDSDDIQSIFNNLDINRDGKLDRHELKVFLTSFLNVWVFFGHGVVAMCPP